jgi:hypothetical protein
VASKWHIIDKKVNPPFEVVYDTSPRTTTRAAHGGSLIGGTRALHAQVGLTRWITWFGPSEHNTLRPRRDLLYCCVLFMCRVELD